MLILQSSHLLPIHVIIMHLVCYTSTSVHVTHMHAGLSLLYYSSPDKVLQAEEETQLAPQELKSQIEPARLNRDSRKLKTGTFLLAYQSICSVVA